MDFNYCTLSMIWKIFVVSVIFYGVTLLLSLIPTVILEILAAILIICLSMAWTLALLLLADKDISIRQAITLSTKAVVKHFFKVLGLMICIAVAMLLTVLTLLIGGIWLYPFISNVYAIFYRELFSISTE